MVRRLRSVRAWSARAMHSPARLWKRIVCAIVLATRRRMTSNATYTTVGFLQRCEAAQTDGVDHFIWSTSASEILCKPPETHGVMLALQQRPEMVCRHPGSPTAALLRATLFAKMSWSRENHGPRRSKRSSRRRRRDAPEAWVAKSRLSSNRWGPSTCGKI